MRLLDVLYGQIDDAIIVLHNSNGETLWRGYAYSALPDAYESYYVEEYWDCDVLDIANGGTMTVDITIDTDGRRMDAPMADGFGFPEVPSYDYHFEGGRKATRKRRMTAAHRRFAGGTPLTCKTLLQHMSPYQPVKIDGLGLGFYEGVVEDALYGYDGEYADDRLLMANVYGVESDGGSVVIYVERF